MAVDNEQMGVSTPTETDLVRVLNHALVPVAGVYEIDPMHTFVGFNAQHLVVGRVRGRFESVHGTITIAEEIAASTVEVSIDSASVSTLLPMRDDDLRSEHYLDVAHHPTMHFASAALSDLPGGRWLLRGDLTLRGRPRQVEFEVRFGGAVADPFGNARIAFQAFGSITRNDFGLTYELAKEAGRADVRGDVDFTLDVEAIRPL